MVEVAVGIYRQYGIQTLLRDKLRQHLILTRREVSRINYDTLLRIVPYDICILLNRIKNKFYYLHNCILLFLAKIQIKLRIEN